MRTLPVFLAVFVLLGFAGCKKEFPAKPVIILQYDVNGNSFSRSETVSSNKTLFTSASANWSAMTSADSIIMIYSSTILNGSSTPVATFTLYKAYSKIDLDNVNGGTAYIPKTDALFYEAFKTGNTKVRWLGQAQNEPAGFSFALSTNDGAYTSSPANTTSNYPETETEYKIVSSTSDIDWLVLQLNNNDLPSTGARKVMVNIEYKCKLFNVNNQSEEVLTNGIFQSYFIDRN